MSLNDRYLFRGKRITNDVNTGKWVEGYLSWCDEITVASDMCPDTGAVEGVEFAVDSTTIGQCTGLKDKNGKLIFEGDIMQLTQEKKPQVVKWEFGGTPQYVFGVYGTSKFDSVYHEIIGNIHDNPNLIRGAK